MKPVLFVTGHAPVDRVGAFARLHERELIEVALFGGRLRHGATLGVALPFPHRYVREPEVLALAASGRYRAVVCSSAGRVALPAAWAGARMAGVPAILWTALWAHPRTVAHAASFVALRRFYRTANAVVTYGEHVSTYVREHGARNVHVAPQAVDNERWRAPAGGAPADPAWPVASEVKALFVGRAAREKGLAVLLDAWALLARPGTQAALAIVGGVPRGLRGHPALGNAGQAHASARGEARDGPLVVVLGHADADALRNYYAAADVLVVPSVRTRTFREPWGLVVNEAFNQALPVIASDAVGAVAGGFVRDERNGIVVPGGRAAPLAGALGRMIGDGALRARMGAAGARDVLAYTFDAWARGFAAALESVGASSRGLAPSPGPDAGAVAGQGPRAAAGAAGLAAAGEGEPPGAGSVV